MNCISNKYTNVILRSPPDWDNTHGECTDLPVAHYDGIYYSYWEVTFLESIKVLFGYNIRLCICSKTHPPVALDVE